MIYTLTLNPSIDYIVHLDKFVSGITNHTTSEEYYIGGKGINVSFILAQLGTKSTALGFCAGFTGDAIEKGLAEMGICSEFIRLSDGISRINIKLKADEESEINGQGPHISEEALTRINTKLKAVEESEINGQGPHISEEALTKLFKKTERISDGDTIVLAGSIPKTAADDTYERILKQLDGKDVRIVVDATKKLLLSCLSYRPFLIKPNRQELSEIFGVPADNDAETERCARELMKKGARNVIVSLGGEGAVLFAEDGKTYRMGTVKQKVLNTVGSGDSMVAGFIAGFEQTGDYGSALKLGTACGNATAFSPGLADRKKIDEILQQL